MIHVYLDDCRPCPQGFVLARNVEECLLLLEAYEVDILSLDHDLGWKEPNGYEVARWIAEHRRFPKRVYLHSSDADARRRMFELLYVAKPDSMQLSSLPMPDDLVDEIALRSQP